VRSKRRVRAYEGLAVMKTFDPDIEALLGPNILSPAESRELAIVGGAHEGASRFSRELALWAPALQSADRDILPEKAETDARARDMVRNDAYVNNGQSLHRDGIVGSLFALNAKPSIGVLGLDEAWATEFQAEVEEKFTLWAESPNNWPDAARINTLTALVRLAIGTYTMGGEVLATVEWPRESDRQYRTSIQMIENERLSTPYLLMDDPNVRGGIERNRYGAPQAYHIRRGHPTDPWQRIEDYEWVRVPIRKPWGRLQVIHILEQTRIDQTRGISEMVSALKEMRTTKKYRDIVLQNAVVNATYAATIESDLPPDAAFASLGGGDDIGEGVANYAASYLGAIGQYAGNSRNMHIDGVRIPHLFPGTKLQLRNAGTAGGVGTGFEQSLLRYIAANLGVTYEELSRDYSQTNYSSIKAAVSVTGRFMASRKKMVADRFASAIYRLWFEEALNKNDITSMPRNAPNFYENMNGDAYTSCDWIGAGKGQIDELKETQAAVLRLKYHLSTYEDEMGRLGKDWRKTLAQRERETKELKARDLVVEESNAINAASGAPRQSGDTGDSEEKAA
jgi:lambda family phage portal protein